MSTTADQIFDKRAALERMAFDPQLFREMIDLLREDGPRRLAELQSALDAGDLARVHQAAHSLKGLAANFNAGRTVQAAGAVEKMAKSAGSVPHLTAAASELQEALRELLMELEDHA